MTVAERPPARSRATAPWRADLAGGVNDARGDPAALVGYRAHDRGGRGGHGERHPEPGRRTFDPRHSERDRLSAPGRDCDYRLTDTGQAWIDDFGVKVATGSRRPLIGYCVDGSEQRHHLAGALGAALLTRLIDLGWVRPAPASRAVHITGEGRTGLATALGIETPGAAERLRADFWARPKSRPVVYPLRGRGS